jgi:hypothetical protein
MNRHNRQILTPAAVLLAALFAHGCAPDASGEWRLPSPRVSSSEASTAACFALPVEGYVPRDGCLEFLHRNPAYQNRRHVADDYCVAQGTRVNAAAAGRVMFADENGDCPDWGHLIAIEHEMADGKKVVTLYGHTLPSVRPGDLVEKGQQIGVIGRYPCWRDHLHFAVYENAYNAPADVYADWMLGYLRSEDAPVEPWTEPVTFIQSHDDCDPAPTPTATAGNHTLRTKGRQRIVTLRWTDPEDRAPTLKRIVYEYKDPTRQRRTGQGDFKLVRGAAGKGIYRWTATLHGTAFRFYTEWEDARGHEIRYPADGWLP